jgi:hypothetical protein
VPLIALVLAAACSADPVTGPSSQTPPSQARHTGGMMGGGG